MSHLDEGGITSSWWGWSPRGAAGHLTVPRIVPMAQNGLARVLTAMSGKPGGRGADTRGERSGPVLDSKAEGNFESRASLSDSLALGILGEVLHTQHQTFQMFRKR